MCGDITNQKPNLKNQKVTFKINGNELCIGTAQVGVSLVSLFDPLYKRPGGLRCIVRYMFDVILVTHKSIMTVPTTTLWTPTWYATYPTCCVYLLGLFSPKNMMMTYQQFPRLRYLSQVSVISFVELAGSSRSLPNK